MTIDQWVDIGQKILLASIVCYGAYNTVFAKRRDDEIQAQKRRAELHAMQDALEAEFTRKQIETLTAQQAIITGLNNQIAVLRNDMQKQIDALRCELDAMRRHNAMLIAQIIAAGLTPIAMPECK